uniref:Uncharacterized protein n=1 Tax=Solanum lycopersicum TaxID=4081 RepID=A0A3Q7EYJ6_SOLLC
RKGLRHSQRD